MRLSGPARETETFKRETNRYAIEQTVRQDEPSFFRGEGPKPQHAQAIKSALPQASLETAWLAEVRGGQRSSLVTPPPRATGLG